MRVRWLGAMSLVLIKLALASTDANGCPTVCSRTDTYAIGANFQPCACAAPDCTCIGECRGAFQSHIMLYAKNSSGVCDSFATDCSIPSCSSAGSASNTGTPTTTATTNSNTNNNNTNNNGNTHTSTTGSSNKSPTGAGSKSSTSPSTTTMPPGNNGRNSGSGSHSTQRHAGSNGAGGPTGSNGTGNATKGLQTWQIILIIASSVAVFLVIAVALLSAYCKVRRDLARSEITEGGFFYADEGALAVQEQVRPSGWRSSPDSGSPHLSEKAALGESSSTVNGNRYSQSIQSYDGARFSDQMQLPPSSQTRPSYSPSFDKAVSETRPRQNSIEL